MTDCTPCLTKSYNVTPAVNISTEMCTPIHVSVYLLNKGTFDINFWMTTSSQLEASDYKTLLFGDGWRCICEAVGANPAVDGYIISVCNKSTIPFLKPNQSTLAVNPLVCRYYLHHHRHLLSLHLARKLMLILPQNV